MLLKRILTIGLVLTIGLAGCDKSAPPTKPALRTPKKSPEIQPPALLTPTPTTPPIQAQPVSPTPTPPVAANNGPRWQCDAPIQDFGAVWVGTRVEKRFQIRNIGNEVLKIEEPKPHCSCSSTPDYTKEIPPGGTGIIPFVMTTVNKPNGPINEYLTVETNDPANRSVQIWIRGSIKTVVAEEVTYDSLHEQNKAAGKEVLPIEKMKGAFGKIKADDQLHRIIKLRNTSGQPLVLTMQPLQAGSKFAVDFKEVVPSEEFELTIRGNPPFPTGWSNLAIAFTTNVPEQPSYLLYASAQVPERLEIIPTKIVYDPKKYGNAARPIKIINHGATPVEIISVATSEPRYTISVQPRNPKAVEDEQVINVYLVGGEYRIPPYGEVIEIRTTDPEKSVIKIQVNPTMDPPAPRPADKPLQMTPIPLPAKG